MSGPKTLGYTVVETEVERRAREQRRLEEIRRQLSVQRQQLVERAAVAQAAYGISIDVPEVAVRGSGSTVEQDRYSRELAATREKLSAVEHALGERVQATRREAVLARLAGTGASETEVVLSASSALAAQRARAESEADAAQRVKLVETVARVTGRLDPGAPKETVDRIERAAAAVLSEEGFSVAQRGVDALRLEVQQANDVAERADQRRHELEQLRGRLVELPGPRTDEMLRALDALERTDAGITTALTAAVEQACSAEKLESERRRVTEALKSSLADLGYDVGNEFERLLGDDGVADARQPRWRGYALRVRSGAESSDVRFNIVREEAAGPLQRVRDKEIEESWCSDFERLVALLEGHGIEPEILRRTPAGTLPVPAAQPAAEAAAEGQITDEPQEQSARP